MFRPTHRIPIPTVWVMYKPEPYSQFWQLGKQLYSFTLGNSNPELKSINTIMPLLVTIKQLCDILEVCHIMWHVPRRSLHSLITQILKDATLFFSHGTPNLATVIPAMDHINQQFTTEALDTKYEPAIRSSLGIAKKTLNRYYNMTDHSEVYCIAISKFFVCILLHSYAHLLHSLTSSPQTHIFQECRLRARVDWDCGEDCVQRVWAFICIMFQQGQEEAGVSELPDSPKVCFLYWSREPCQWHDARIWHHTQMLTSSIY